MEIKTFIPRVLDRVAQCVGNFILRDVDYSPNTGGAPLIDAELYPPKPHPNPYEPMYSVHDDGVNPNSTYDSLFGEGDGA